MLGSKTCFSRSTRGTLASLKLLGLNWVVRYAGFDLGVQNPAFTHSKQPILASNHAFLRQKICLMALIEAVFKRSNNNRSMSFQTISEEVRLPIDEVEHLVMKALRCDVFYFFRFQLSGS